MRTVFLSVIPYRLRLQRQSPAASVCATMQMFCSSPGSSASYTTDGNTITFEGTSATLQFTAASQGQSSLIVSSPTITGSSASVQVAGGTGDMNTQQTQDTQDTATQAADGQFVIGGVAYVVPSVTGERDSGRLQPYQSDY